MVREIITEWDIPNGGEGLSIMYFDEATAVAAQRAGLAAFWTDVRAVINSQVRWTIRTDGRELNDATGVLEGFWNDSTPHTATGSETGDPVTNVSQALVRWLTADVVGGRRVQGRQFIPGLSEGQSSGGEVASTGLGLLQAAAQAFATAGVGFGVWHRPQSGLGGSFHLVTAGSAWNEFATQRGRRS